MRGIYAIADLSDPMHRQTAVHHLVTTLAAVVVAGYLCLCGWLVHQHEFRYAPGGTVAVPGTASFTATTTEDENGS